MYSGPLQEKKTKKTQKLRHCGSEGGKPKAAVNCEIKVCCEAGREWWQHEQSETYRRDGCADGLLQILDDDFIGLVAVLLLVDLEMDLLVEDVVYRLCFLDSPKIIVVKLFVQRALHAVLCQRRSTTLALYFPIPLTSGLIFSLDRLKQSNLILGQYAFNLERMAEGELSLALLRLGQLIWTGLA